MKYECKRDWVYARKEQRVPDHDFVSLTLPASINGKKIISCGLVKFLKLLRHGNMSICKRDGDYAREEQRRSDHDLVASTFTISIKGKKIISRGPVSFLKLRRLQV